MYNMPDLSSIFDSKPEVSSVQRTGGIMQRARLEVEREEPYDAQSSIMNHMRKYRESAEPEEVSTTEAAVVPPNPVEVSQRPRARGTTDIFNAPLRPLLSSAFKDNLELDETAAETLSKAFLLNFQDESGMIPDRIESEPNVHGTRGKGYYQLTGDRRDRFESLYGPEGYTDENQVEFLVEELTGSESRAGREILAAAQSGNVGETAAIIVSRFLRPAARHRDERAARYRANF